MQALEFLKQNPGAIDAAPLAANLSRVRDLLVDLMEPFLTKKNMQKLVGDHRSCCASTCI